MILPDVNVLIYAFRKDVPQHAVCRRWLAALAIEWGCEWITFDHDFARFPGLKWRVPAA
jgi:predicted nucleic acid-binding protein